MALKQIGHHDPSVYSSLTRTSHPSPNVTAKEAEESLHRRRKKMDMVRFTNLY